MLGDVDEAVVDLDVVSCGMRTTETLLYFESRTRLRF